MDMTADFVSWLQSELNHRGWSQSELARRGGFTPTAINKILSRERMPGVDFCKGVARALGMRDVDVMRIADLIDPDERSVAYPPAIRRAIAMMLDMDDETQRDAEAVVSAIWNRWASRNGGNRRCAG